MSCSTINVTENTTPMTAIDFSKDVPSLSLFSITSVAAEVKNYPIDAPIADISTNQPSASLPRIGPDSDTTIQNIIAFLGVPYFGSFLENTSGRYPSLAIEFMSLDEAR